MQRVSIIGSEVSAEAFPKKEPFQTILFTCPEGEIKGKILEKTGAIGKVGFNIKLEEEVKGGGRRLYRGYYNHIDKTGHLDSFLAADENENAEEAEEAEKTEAIEGAKAS